MLIGLLLCFYFSFHIIKGARGFSALIDAKRELVENSDIFQNLQHEKITLQKKVVGLRPESVNKDLLEEQVRYILGYQHPNEINVIPAQDL